MDRLNIEELIDELAAFIDGCKTTPLSGGKVSVPKEEFLAQLEELKMEIPPEVERSKEIVMKKDMILQEAQHKADAMINNAAKEAGIMIDRDEIVALANMRASEIIKDAKQKAADLLDKAEEEAEGIQLGAMKYTSAVLAGLENMFQSLFDNQKEQLDATVDSLGKNLSTLKANRAEIDSQLERWEASPAQNPDEK